uniref:Anoctamin n=1 Tax=Bombyx mori TaxID=7091 RepID=A0A8R2M2H1_BOMMO|nr:anoctamin-5 isoform X2 [Bombyx mori]
MDRKYCRKFKYFRDQIGVPAAVDNNNTVATEENEDNRACHKIKLYKFNLLSKFTQVVDETPQETPPEPNVEEEIAVEPTDEEQFETHSFTGTFRDEKRRIDLMLVIPDDKNLEAEKIRTNFLLNIIKAGLEIELEYGLMEKHKNLIFVKIHAPDMLLEEYGEKLGVKKYFKECHIEYIPLKRIFTRNSEREWIELIRLLNMNIIADAYALHDGPYFLTRRQDFSKVSGRQILYYNWTGLCNIFKLQPLNVINEYFGSRIGFYFAFLQFYNLGLSIAALGGIIITLLGIFDKTYETVYKDVCHDKLNKTVCPRCSSFIGCPFLNLKKYYCFGTKLVNVLDNGYLHYYCYFVVLWGPILMILWRRREMYLLWMWELYNVKEMVSTRPEFSMNYSKPNQSTDTGLWKYYNSGIMKWLRWILSASFVIICIFLSFFIPIKLVIYEYDTLLEILTPDKFPNSFEKYMRISIFTIIVLTVMLLYEMVCRVTAIFVTRLENHKTVESYERSMAMKLVMISFCATFPIMIHYSWFKSNRFYVPGRIYTTQKFANYYFLRHMYARNCGINPCIDDVFVALTVSFLCKQILPKFLLICKNLFIYQRTDYNQGRNINKTIPCWEREYRLQSITERTLALKYNYLALQFGFVTLFVSASPLIPLLALIVNLLDIRYNANQFLLASRRALLLDRSGLDIWSNMLTIISYLSILSNAVLMAWSSRFIKRRFYLSNNNTMDNFFAFTTTRFVSQDFLKLSTMSKSFKAYKGFIPNDCYYPGVMLYLPEYKVQFPNFNIFYFYPNYVPLPEHYQIKTQENSSLIIYEYVGLMVVLLAQYLISGTSKDVEDTIKIERKLKEAYITYTG